MESIVSVIFLKLRSLKILVNSSSNLLFRLLFGLSLSISFNLFLILFLSDLLSNIPNLVINFFILIIIDFISWSGSACRWFKYLFSLWCFSDRIKIHKSSDLFNPVESTFQSWTSFLQISAGKSDSLLMSSSSFWDIFSFLARLECFNLFNLFNSLIISIFFLYNSSIMFFEFCFWWYLSKSSINLIWFFLWTSLKSTCNMLSRLVSLKTKPLIVAKWIKSCFLNI